MFVITNANGLMPRALEDNTDLCQVIIMNHRMTVIHLEFQGATRPKFCRTHAQAWSSASHMMQSSVCPAVCGGKNILTQAIVPLCVGEQTS